MFSRALASSAAILAFAAISVHAEPYTNPNGYSLEPPPNWTLWESPDQLSARWNDPDQKSLNASVVVSVTKLTGVVVPAEALPHYVAGLPATYKKTMMGFTLSEAGKTMLGGVPARYLSATYRLTAKGPVCKIRQVVAIRGRLRTTVTCAAPASSFPKDQALFSRTIASFRFGAVESPSYRSEEGYRLTPAKGWAAQAPTAIGGDVHFVEAGTHVYPANLGLHIMKTNPPMTIDDLTAHRAQIEAGLAKEAQYVVVDHGVETISGEKALFITAHLNNPLVPTPLWVRLTFIPHAGKVYRFSGL